MSNGTDTPRKPGIFFGAKGSGLTKREDALEADLVATWFARAGALALLVGAGFGYRYAVDRGLIGPGGRVALGIMAAVALIFLAERTAARGWSPFAQAAAGGGTGLLYVTTWAAFHHYELIDARTAFGLLGAVAIVGAVLALRHDSQALAVLSTLGAFANPVVVGDGSLGTMTSLGYVLTVDLCVLALARYRRWEILNWVAAVSSWALFAPHASEVPVVGGVTFVSAYQLIFVGTALAGVLRRKRDADTASSGTDMTGRESVFLAVNAWVHVAAVMALMTPELPDSRGPALGIIGAFYLAVALGLWKRRAPSEFVATTAVIGGVLAVAWVPLHFELEWVPAIWSAEGAIALFAGYFVRSLSVRLVGAVLTTSSVAVSIVLLGDGITYDPDHLFVSWISLAWVVHASSLFAAAFALLRHGEGEERQIGTILVVLANAMTLIYMSLEASAYVNRTAAAPERHQVVQFALTAVWSAYACALVAVGVVRNARLLRYLGVGLFGATILKLVLSDVWLLATGYRTVVFVGVGVLLLACSLMYSRFKELLLEDRAPTHAQV
ncbi:MAG TPA: DUF2339 domain-containing protein [Actinomycetota bacterium]|jgi:uncharacterized membrane protein